MGPHDIQGPLSWIAHPGPHDTLGIFSRPPHSGPDNTLGTFFGHHTQALMIPSAKSLHHHTRALTMASSLIHHTRAHSTSRAHFHGSSTQALMIPSAHFLGHHWPTVTCWDVGPTILLSTFPHSDPTIHLGIFHHMGPSEVTWGHPTPSGENHTGWARASVQSDYSMWKGSLVRSCIHRVLGAMNFFERVNHYWWC